MNYQVFGDVCETGATWSDLNEVHATVYDAFYQVRRDADGPGFMFCHMSHSYHGGACLYFTFAFPYSSDETALDEYYDRSEERRVGRECRSRGETEIRS